MAEAAGVEERYPSDSAGTGAWHVGNLADPRSREVAARNGVRLEGRARQVRSEDFHRFDLILAMDRSNLSDLKGLHPGGETRARLRLFREFDPEADGETDVPDPYYGGPEGFDRVFEMVSRGCRSLLDSLENGET